MVAPSESPAGPGLPGRPGTEEMPARRARRVPAGRPAGPGVVDGGEVLSGFRGAPLAYCGRAGWSEGEREDGGAQAWVLGAGDFGPLHLRHRPARRV
jgi:hypothetical protein